MTPIELPAGVAYAPTPASNSAAWRETHLIRWADGKLCPVGGWERVNYTIPFASRLRAMHVWTSNSGSIYTAYLCEAHLYVDIGGVLTDISPAASIVAPYADVAAGGFGDDKYNYDKYGTPRPNRPRNKAVTPAYTLDNWGEDLLAMTSADGRLLRWSPSTPSTKAVAVTGAPVSNRTFVVTAERHVILFGMGGDSRRWGWCDQEDIENWDFANVASKAGFYDVEPASPIITAKAGRGGIIFHTAKKVYHIRHVGMPYIYNQGEEIGDSSTPMSHASMLSVGDRITWVTENGLWSFNGASIDPVMCPVWAWVAERIDVVKSRYEAAMVDFVNKNELWWFFTSKDAVYNDCYVIWNYREGWWAMGELSRSCGVGSSYTTFPTLSDGINVYRHESGLQYPDAAEAPWAETFTINIRSGAGLMTVDQLLPDVQGAEPGEVLFSFDVSEQRYGGTTRRTPKQPVRPNGYVDVRQTGRDFRMRIEAAAISAKCWTMGQTMIDVKVRGKK